MRTYVRVRREAPSILHADADAFFASVEQRDDPALRGKPLVVGKGVVMAASYEARRHGIHGGMNGRRARRLCPGLVAVSPRFDAYVEASRQLFEVFRRRSPVVEGLSMEEAFLDVTGLERILGLPGRDRGTPARRGARARSASPSRSASPGRRRWRRWRAARRSPTALLVVAPDRERAFIEPLPVESLWGVGPSTARALHELGVRTVDQIASMPVSALATAVGNHAAHHLNAVALCRDARRVRANRSRRSIGSQTAFPGGSKTRRPR